MSYSHQVTQHQIVVAADVSGAADPVTGARLFPGRTPMVVKALWATITTQVTTLANTLTFKYRPTPGSASGEETIGTLVLPTSAVIGKQLYKDVTPYKASPGGEIVIQTDGVGDAGGVTAGITVEPQWEVPANNTAMIESA